MGIEKVSGQSQWLDAGAFEPAEKMPEKQAFLAEGLADSIVSGDPSLSLFSAGSLLAPVDLVKPELAASVTLTPASQQPQIVPVQSQQTSGNAIAAETRLPNESTMPNYDQGSTNGCGTTSLGMIMSYLTGTPITQADIDNEIRRADIFTAPKNLLDFARDRGLAAEGYNNGTWEELKGFIDKGIPCQALISADGTADVTSLHYIAITGHGTDPATNREYVLYHDPATGKEEKMNVDEFQQKWSAPIGGFENYFNAYAPKGTDLPSSRFDGVEGTLALVDGVANLGNGVNRIFDPDNFGCILHGVIEVAGGAVQTVGAAVGGAVSLAGQWVGEQVEDVPVLENVVQPLTDIVDGIGAGLADIFDGIGQGVDSIGSGVESLFEGAVGDFFVGVGEGLYDIGEGIVNGVGDVISSVGDAISDFFSGW